MKSNFVKCVCHALFTKMWQKFQKLQFEVVWQNHSRDFEELLQLNNKTIQLFYFCVLKPLFSALFQDQNVKIKKSRFREFRFYELIHKFVKYYAFQTFTRPEKKLSLGQVWNIGKSLDWLHL